MDFRTLRKGKEKKRFTKIEQIASFWQKIAISTDDQCWEWIGGKTGCGYGLLQWDGRGELSHRISYEIQHGIIPAGKLVLHNCNNPGCVNPNHLRLGTHKENSGDMRKAGTGTNFVGYGEDSSSAKLTAKQVIEIRNADMDALTASRIYGVSRRNIYSIRANRTWKKFNGKENRSWMLPASK